MSLLRPLILACLHFNILFQARHVAGSKNLLPSAARKLLPVVDELLKSSLAPNTALTYSRAWSSFTVYSTSVYKQVLNLPISPADLCLFVAYLHDSGKAPKTISTYLSALGYIHKITGLSDPTTSFIVSKLMAGAYRSRLSFDLRLPITITILDQLVDALNHTVPTLYDIQSPCTYLLFTLLLAAGNLPQIF